MVELVKKVTPTYSIWCKRIVLCKFVQKDVRQNDG